MIVVDASIVVSALVDDEDEGRLARRRIRSDVSVAPELVDIEVASALRGLTLERRLDGERAGRAIRALSLLGIRRTPHRPLVRRCWELRHNLTPYDASYAALAEALHCDLVTRDEAFGRTPGLRCRVEML